MANKQKAAPPSGRQWAKFAAVASLYLLFLYWVGSWWGLVAVPFIFDAYVTKRIRWQWWRDCEGPVRFVMSWVDALVFALVAVYFINLFFFQNYVIPSSSLEKSLLTGDYLFVSKVSYGPRIPQTPLTMPLTQHTMPVLNCRSYIGWPSWEYRRVRGLGKVGLNDIVVFNYPAGDTVMTSPRYQAADYYQQVYKAGTAIQSGREPGVRLAGMDALARREFFERAYAAGREFVARNRDRFGETAFRPTDRRENYVKRCVGMPGQTLQVRDGVVYLDGRANKEPDNVQYTYFVKLAGVPVSRLLGEEYAGTRRELGISEEDITTLAQLHGYDVEEGNVLDTGVLRLYDGYMPLTARAAAGLVERGIARSLRRVTDRDIYAGPYYPLDAFTGWTRDNYGPVWIPEKGGSVRLTLENLPLYERPIRVYEGNSLEVRDGEIYINGSRADTYTFRMDYYWMQGDNRHNSADSRYWGFVPEDHIVGKPLFIWWSSDPDGKGLAAVRWERLFRWVDGIR